MTGCGGCTHGQIDGPVDSGLDQKTPSSRTEQTKGPGTSKHRCSIVVLIYKGQGHTKLDLPDPYRN